MSHRPCKDPTMFHLNKSSGRYSAWVRRPSDSNKRHYIGCFTTFHMAARAQDRALLKINADAPVNFKSSDYRDDVGLRATLSETEFLKMLRDESRPTYKVVEKSLCFDKFKRMEDYIEDLRQVSQLNIQNFVAHLATHPSPSPEVNDAAETLLELFGSPTAGDLVRPVTWSSNRKLIENVLALNIPKGKRSPGTPRMRGGVASSSEDADSRPQTRAYSKRKLKMSPSCSYRRSRS